MEGLGNTACSLRCLACFDHVHGWTIWVVTVPASSNPLSRSIGSLASCSATGPFGSWWTSGSLNSNSTRARTSLVPKPLPSCDASFASDRSIPRTPGSVSSHHPSPLPRATYDWEHYPIGSPFSIAMYWSDGLLQNALASTVPVRQSVRACFFSAPPLDDMRSI